MLNWVLLGNEKRGRAMRTAYASVSKECSVPPGNLYLLLSTLAKGTYQPQRLCTFVSFINSQQGSVQ